MRLVPIGKLAKLKGAAKGLGRAATALEAGVGLYRGGQAINILQDENGTPLDAAGPAAEALLRLMGVAPSAAKELAKLGDFRMELDIKALQTTAFTLGGSIPGLKVIKAVNSDIVHAAERAVERGVFPDIQSAKIALRDLGKKIRTDGLPAGTIADPKRADSVLVPFGSGWAVYEIRKNGTAILRTVLGATSS